MTDFSKLFTDPSAEVYGADETENAMWQQSSTNPFAVLHAIAARRNANNRRDQYGQQLAAHDQRAQSGASSLMQQENKYNVVQKMIEQKMIDPGTVGDLADIRTAGNSGQFDALSDIFAANNKAAAFKDMGAGSQSFAAAGKDPMQEDSLSNLIGVGNLADVATTGEREQDARGRNDAKLPFKKNIVEPRPDANGNMVTYQENYGTREEMLGQPAPSEPAPVKTGGGFTHGGKPNKNAKPAPGMQPPESTKRNAPGQAPTDIPPAGPVSSMQFKSLPPAQQRAIAQLRDKGYTAGTGHVFKLVPNSVKNDGNGNVVVTIRTTADGQVFDQPAQIGPDGRIL